MNIACEMLVTLRIYYLNIVEAGARLSCFSARLGLLYRTTQLLSYSSQQLKCSEDGQCPMYSLGMYSEMYLIAAY